LGIALGETLEDVDSVIDLSVKVVRVEVPVAVFARLENNPGFTGKCEDVR
jgi:hypothetical protein